MIEEPPPHDCQVSKYIYCNNDEYIISCDYCGRYLGSIKLQYPRDIEFTRKLKATRYPKGRAAKFTSEILKDNT